MVVADAGLLENRRAPATTLEGWRSFISADPSELALLPREQWEALGERDRRDYDEARPDARSTPARPSRPNGASTPPAVPAGRHRK